MEQNQVVEKKRSAPRVRRVSSHSFEMKLKAVKLQIEEGFAANVIAQEMGVNPGQIYKWKKLYQLEGEDGLRPKYSFPRKGSGSLAEPVVDKIIELKRENSWYGVKRISQVLRRVFFLKASPETVRKTLQQASLMEGSPKSAPRNMSRPRHFERATPNQMWQSDIFTFKLGGRYSYLIAFMDDYSRFIVSAELYRSATAAAVIEVFRRGAGEYQPPKEMLTDRGPQYTNWRGKSRFEAEMQKERIHHIKSRAQHPMTLGKVERFWSTIWTEFLSRAQFDSFESARERIAFWVKYYNHKRPNQGIEGLCPADRYFEIQNEMRATIEKGIQENVLEMALRGQPRAPFYMVGRMEGQSVVLRAEKGKLKLSVGDEQKTEELVYDLNKGKQNERETGKTNEEAQSTVRCDAEGSGSPCNMDREMPADSGLSGNGHPGDSLAAVARSSVGGNASGAGTQDSTGQRSGAESSLADAITEAAKWLERAEARRALKQNPGEQNRKEDGITERNMDEWTRTCTRESECDLAGPEREDHCDGRSSDVGDLAQELLPVGTKGVGGNDRVAGGSGGGTSFGGNRSGKGNSASENPETGEGSRDRQAERVGSSNPAGYEGSGS